VLHLTVGDAAGRGWGLSTFDSDWSPSNPASFLGKIVSGANLDVPSGRLTIAFSDESLLTVAPIPDVEDDELETGRFTPDGFVLDYGPGPQWQLVRADDPPS
jgi:hypothetical protein